MDSAHEIPDTVVYKYLVPLGGDIIPVGEIIHVGYQDNLLTFPTIWVRHRVSDSNELLDHQTMKVTFVGTGERISSLWHAVGSVQTPMGLVWHVFTYPND